MDDVDATETRTEHDTLGPVQVPRHARWGAQTQRAIENFPISGRALDPRLVRAIALVKREAALTNAALDEVAAVDDRVGAAVAAAADEVIAGRWDDEFPIDVYQTGSGTSSNMNVNEVLASLASERLGGDAVHPNDQVNASQSSNDVIPTAIRVAAAQAVADELDPALAHLQATLERRAADLADVVKAGRTHLMDAVPVTLGQELGGWARQVADARERLAGCLPRVGQLPLGGTATGTGLNCPAGFAPTVIAGLAAWTGLELVEAPDHFAVQGAMDALVELSGHLRTLAVALTKIANDVRWMGSGPRAGLAEIRLPDLQPGSSIMPGKVNPVLPEVVTQVAARVVGNDATVGFAGSQGSFELNTYLPVVADALVESIVLLSSASRVFADRCLAGIEADEERCRAYAEATPAVATALNPVIGYEAAAAIVKESMRTGTPVRELVLERGLVPEDELDRVLDLRSLAEPHGR
jgi:fumarate hydratase class II